MALGASMAATATTVATMAVGLPMWTGSTNPFRSPGGALGTGTNVHLPSGRPSLYSGGRDCTVCCSGARTTRPATCCRTLRYHPGWEGKTATRHRGGGNSGQPKGRMRRITLLGAILIALALPASALAQGNSTCQAYN